MAVLTPEQQQQYAAERLGLQNQTALQKRRLEEDYGLESRLLREQSDRDQYEIGGQLASQGLFNSGIRVNEQGQVVRRMNEGIGQLDINRARGLEDADYGLTTRLADIAGREREALAEANRREAQQAIERELLQAQKDAAIRAAIPMPNPIINYPQSVPVAPVDPYAAYLAKQRADAEWGVQQTISRNKYQQKAANNLYGNYVNGAPKLTPLYGKF